MIARTPTPVTVRVEELRDRAAIGALAPEWEALAARAGVRGPFVSPRWMAVWAAHLAPRSLRVLVAHRAGRVCAILPLFAEQRAIAGIPARVLRSLSDDHSQRFDLIAEDEDAAAALLA